MSTRNDGRALDAHRAIAIETRVQRYPEGSLIYRSGKTSVLVAVSISEGTPDWMRTPGHGWLTAEYAMHPRANPYRQRRDGRGRTIDGRSSEIQRLISRALRACLDLEKLGERTIMLDCDVLDADGGTRTAAITGGFVGLAMALDSLRSRGLLKAGVLREPIAAISVGWLEGRALLDLCYEEDSAVQVDLNVVASRSGGIVEVQGTAEGAPIPRAQFDQMLDLALGAMPSLMAAQRAALAEAEIDLDRLLR